MRHLIITIIAIVVVGVLSLLSYLEPYNYVSKPTNEIIVSDNHGDQLTYNQNSNQIEMENVAISSWTTN